MKVVGIRIKVKEGGTYEVCPMVRRARVGDRPLPVKTTKGANLKVLLDGFKVALGALGGTDE